MVQFYANIYNYIFLKDKYKRALADSENLRNRLTKQIEEAKIFGIQSFCKDLLDVADVLSKATESVPQEEINDSNPYLKSLYEGLVMTEAQLQNVFKRHGLQQVNPMDEKFNPNLHEALFQQVSFQNTSDKNLLQNSQRSTSSISNYSCLDKRSSCARCRPSAFSALLCIFTT